MRDLIFDAISYCASSYNLGKLSAYDQIVIKNQKKEAMNIKLIFTRMPSKNDL